MYALIHTNIHVRCRDLPETLTLDLSCPTSSLVSLILDAAPSTIARTGVIGERGERLVTQVSRQENWPLTSAATQDQLAGQPLPIPHSPPEPVSIHGSPATICVITLLSFASSRCYSPHLTPHFPPQFPMCLAGNRSASPP